MSEPFPMKADIDFFISEEAKRIQELWEPRFGDLVWHQHLRRCLVLYSGAGEYVRVWSDLTVDQQVHKQYLVFLPRQGQLQEMLEKTTGKRFGALPVEFHGEEYWIAPFPGSSFERYKKGKSANARGPTAAIALGRGLLEVIQGGKK